MLLFYIYRYTVTVCYANKNKRVLLFVGVCERARVIIFYSLFSFLPSVELKAKINKRSENVACLKIIFVCVLQNKIAQAMSMRSRFYSPQKICVRVCVCVCVCVYRLMIMYCVALSHQGEALYRVTGRHYIQAYNSEFCVQ
jgi:hypothetical protein